MFNFPEYSDLGDITSAMRHTWQDAYMRMQACEEYFDGSVFEEKVPLEVGPDEEEPLLYPVGINLVKMLCQAQTDATFGEWDENIFNFVPRRDTDETNDDIIRAIDILNDIMFFSGAERLFLELQLDREVYGGAVVKVYPGNRANDWIRWSRIHPLFFLPIFDPEDPDQLLEAYVGMQMTAEQAKAKYKVSNPTAEIVLRVEHWTKTTYTNVVDGKQIAEFSGVNPWGVVPFVYIPRIRTTRLWGDSLAEDIMAAQDELNMRVADIGEAINYNAHPVRYGVNLPKSFNVDNYPIAPNALWDLGRQIGQSPEPQVGMLEAKTAVSEAAFGYVQFLYDWSRTSSFAPPIAFGEDNGGGQRSGATLEIRMWPLVKSVRRSRAYLASGIQRMVYISAVILKQKSYPGVPSRAVEQLLKGAVKPRFFEVLPRDHAAIVDEIVKLRSTTPVSISLETSQKELGRPVTEVERIKKELKDETLHPPAPEPFGNEGKSNDVQEAMKGKDAPQTKTKSGGDD